MSGGDDRSRWIVATPIAVLKAAIAHYDVNLGVEEMYLYYACERLAFQLYREETRPFACLGYSNLTGLFSPTSYGRRLATGDVTNYEVTT